MAPTVVPDEGSGDKRTDREEPSTAASERAGTASTEGVKDWEASEEANIYRLG